MSESAFRRAVADALNRLPRQCGDNLSRWATRNTPRTVPWSRQPVGCGMDMEAHGQCHCGKLRRP